MKHAIILSYSLLSFGAASFGQQGCLFGGHLLNMARYGHLHASAEKVLASSQPLSPLERTHLIALGKAWHAATGAGSVAQLSDADILATLSSQKVVWHRSITDQLSGQSYAMYLYDSGDNIYGGIFSLADGKNVALVGDGEIRYCFLPAPDMSKRLPAALSGLVLSQETSSCYFGGSLAELARITQFELNSQMVSFRHPNYHSNQEGYLLKDSNSSMDYIVYINPYSYHGTAGLSGQILTKEKPHFVLAEIGSQGKITQCSTEFSDYDSLAWFYSN